MFEIAKALKTQNHFESPIRKIMDMAKPESLRSLGWTLSEIISFAGGWVNHQSPAELREEYAAIVNNPTLFHQSGGYSATEGDKELRCRIVDMEKSIYGIQGLTTDNILIGQSSTQLLDSLILTIMNPGDTIVLFDPTYANYIEQIRSLKRPDYKVVTLKVFDNNSWT